MILAGDVGGTKVLLAYYENDKCLVEKKYRSKEFPEFSLLLSRFLEETKIPSVKAACFGVAGPVKENVCHATNLPWSLDGKVLGKVLKTDNAFLINDVEANAWGIACLTSKELCTLNHGLVIKGNQALISAGTGLGEAGLVWDGEKHHPFACEGGHVDFGPRNALEIELLSYLKRQYKHISYERIVSGHGIYSLYRFLVDTQKEKADPDVEAAKEEEPQKEITKKAMQEQHGVCFQTISLFASIYGAEAGNLALKFLSIGGLFLGGGIVPNILSYFQHPNFLEAFTEKGRFAPLLRSIPVKIVLNDHTALLGAKRYAQEKGGF
jgi:glucokinase